ncbi:MAG: redoxin domain-containing protein [Thermoplasmata archaeon]
MTEKALAEGEQSEDFTLEDHNGNDFKLSDHKGKKVLLSFHPLAWTKVCADQMKSLEANYDRFEDLNTVAVGVSVDSVPSKKAWAEELGIENTPLLCDFWPHGKAIKQFGLFREEDGFSERANILLDEDHKVIFSKVYPIKQVPDIEEILDVIDTK